MAGSNGGGEADEAEVHLFLAVFGGVAAFVCLGTVLFLWVRRIGLGTEDATPEAPAMWASRRVSDPSNRIEEGQCGARSMPQAEGQGESDPRVVPGFEPDKSTKHRGHDGMQQRPGNRTASQTERTASHTERAATNERSSSKDCAASRGRAFSHDRAAWKESSSAPARSRGQTQDERPGAERQMPGQRQSTKVERGQNERKEDDPCSHKSSMCMLEPENDSIEAWDRDAIAKELREAATLLSPAELREFVVDHVEGELMRISALPIMNDRTRAFKDLCTEWHPDKCPLIQNLATEIFQLLQQRKLEILSSQ